MARQKAKPIVASGPVDLDSIEFLPNDFERKQVGDEIHTDSSFTSQNYWKDVRKRFFSKKSAVVGLVLILLIAVMAIVGPGMNDYTYSGQTLGGKEFGAQNPWNRRAGDFRR